MTIKRFFLKIPILRKIVLLSRYFLLRYLINFNYSDFKMFHNYRLIKITSGVSFFGYYNLSPENLNKTLIYLKVRKEIKRGSLNEQASLCVRENSNERIISQTSTWNWQQGAMQQWIGPSYNNIIINDFDSNNNKYYSKLLSPLGICLNKYSMPIYSVSKNGKFALSLNFSRLLEMRPDYAYFNVNKNTLNDDNDGIWFMDLQTNITKLIITLSQLKSLKPSATMVNAIHKVNHIDINPSGTRFMFLHRWVSEKGRFMRLITADLDGSNLFILNGDKMTSHSCWVNNNKIISYCTIDGVDTGYYTFNDKKRDYYLVSSKLPKKDGHPSVSTNGRYLVTDTYPNKLRMSNLYLYEFATDNIIHIGQFYQPFKFFGEMRVDLHPKWNLDGTAIFFESGHSKMRQLYKIKINN